MTHTGTIAELVPALDERGVAVSPRRPDGSMSSVEVMPMSTVVVLDNAGVIRWIDVHPNYATRSEVPDILAAVDAMQRTDV
ncbi:MAG: hypothetical protein VYA67_16450 [Actinomycetota bacterium]|uniref:Uncharacterized protein n=1 Tax=Mycobacterium lentiflavum TaxID=141349 RepID=A0ABY3UZC1_MYCLN|nr:hypothetical protein [Mycobacterium lentiflavum]MEE3065517.1 hypothetical protein [Actinomycetota bacterium]ULP42552.1 hypothetical protein MJO58_00545 [Mycobacterium lentiflavum]